MGSGASKASKYAQPVTDGSSKAAENGSSKAAEKSSGKDVPPPPVPEYKVSRTGLSLESESGPVKRDDSSKMKLMPYDPNCDDPNCPPAIHAKVARTSVQRAAAVQEAQKKNAAEASGVVKETVKLGNPEDAKARERIATAIRFRRKYMMQHDVEELDEIPPDLFVTIAEGVLDVPGIALPVVPSRTEFKHDLSTVWAICKDPVVNSTVVTRLEALEAHFHSYELKNIAVERIEAIDLPGDIYTTMKVDNHIHLAAAMTPRLLLSFIKNKIVTEGDREVLKGKTLIFLIKEALKAQGQPEDLNDLQPESISDLLDVESLGCCAGEHFMNRFDNFNDAYSPLGASALRDVFLKSSNFIKGEYFAQLAHEVIASCEENSTHAEMRLSIYGKNLHEWDDLSEWLVRNKLHTGKALQRNIWLVQIPRVFGPFCKNKLVKNFEELINNIFQPLFEVAIDPDSHPLLAEALPSISGFDCVDDESFNDSLLAHHSQLYKNGQTAQFVTGDALRPELWTVPENPPYSYYSWYLYVNLRKFNDLCKATGRGWHLSFRPHCGEAGPTHHLATSFLLADGINHGINLQHNAVLQYLYYCCQVGCSLSPISNNALFLKIVKNPFPMLFRRGLNVTLSTDDPLMFHKSNEPLLEEYLGAQLVFSLTGTDIMEIAANSVRQSAFLPTGKLHAQDNFKKNEETKRTSVMGGVLYVPYVRDPKRCNIPARRMNYRSKCLADEFEFLRVGAPNIGHAITVTDVIEDPNSDWTQAALPS